MTTENACDGVLLSPKASAPAPMTPRRSARKSIMPQLDYNDIIDKKMLRSESKRAKESKVTKNTSPPQHKWTPSEVGRVSQNRRRKSKRIGTKNSSGGLKELLAEPECVTDNKDKCIEEEHRDKEDDIPIQDKGVDGYAKHEGIATGHIVGETKTELESDVDMKAVIISKSEDSNFQKVIEIDAKEEDKDIGSILIGDTAQLESEVQTKSKSENKEKIVNETKDTQVVDHEKKDITIELKNDEIESFGAYLKSKPIDISDLGLEPLETEDKNDEMPSLLLCDNVDENQQEILNSTFETEKTSVICPETEPLLAQNEQENNILNSTFETTETEPLSAAKKRQNQDHTQNEEPSSTINDEIVMQSLQISDDEEENDVKLVEDQLHISGVINSKNNENRLEQKKVETLQPPTVKFVLTEDNQKRTTLFHCDLPQPTTPKTNPGKRYRQPTPYKAKLRLDISKKKTVLENCIEARSPTVLNCTTLEPREIVLRSIRKRSNSVSINPHSIRSVSFYSPANQILGVEEVDKLMAKSAKKQATSQKDIFIDRNVTKRRKRSISLDDRSFKMSRIPKPTTVSMAPLAKINTISKLPKGASPASKQKSRINLPNFAAIHQKHFNQMENLVQHVERKAERAKILTNSNIKVRPASAQKNQANKSEISTVSKTSNKQLELLFQAEPNTHLPKPRQILDIPIPNTKYSQPKQNNTSRVKQQPMKEQNTVAPASSRPAFTLSTHVTSSMGSSKPISYADKISERRKRHMDMFKGRTTVKRTASGEVQRGDIIRGVRSNRRFELQMQHRKNIEER